MGLNRKPNKQEIQLIELLIKKADNWLPNNWKDELMVCPLDDGAMGSLRLIPNILIKEDRIFGEQVSDFQFTDLDGVEVIASLNLDTEGHLYELDIWKTDFGRLLKLPDIN
ncbi:MAG TPA: hypothetical protein PLE30_11080 [Candidatus Kapabacteria bacterium]|nr:hypothetical protein [Candidatus Kapabacteria bacterium]